MRYILILLFVNILSLLGIEILDNSMVRLNYFRYFNNNALQEQSKVEKNYITTDSYVEVKSKSKGPYTYYLFFNKKDKMNKIMSGSYVIRKNGKEVDLIKIFLLGRTDSFIRIKTTPLLLTADFYLFNNLVYKGIKLPFKIETLLTMPLSKIIEYTSHLVDWKLFNPKHLDLHLNVENIITEFRNYFKQSGEPTEVYDGAMNNKGKMVLIETLLPQKGAYGFNCSGFVKWIADSIYKVKTNDLLKTEELKIRHIGIRGNSFNEKYEFSRDLYFGLDWTRNIAYRLRNDRRNLDLSAITENDVNNVRFAEYIQERGYEISIIEFILYYLAIYEPGYIYLGSVNKTEFHGKPSLIHHSHTVVFFPWIDELGLFKLSVMEVNSETSLKFLEKRYKNSYVHLVRIKALEKVDITPLPKQVSNN